ncbi:MAG: MFS transporter [Clostridia bacterium]|nr:MFS transporter [Clostridia bacterium]
MEKSNFKVYPYRWVVLISFMCIFAAQNIMWITFAPITGEAAKFYGVSDLQIGLLSMVFMITYIIISVPASWVIDTYGFRKGVGVGAVLTIIFGLSRGIFADNYTLVLISQIGISIGQPFIANAITTMASRWFPPDERATASGLGTLSSYIGIIVGMMLTPWLVLKYGMSVMLLVNGIIAVACGLIFVIFARERPASSSYPPEQEEKPLAMEGLKHILHDKNFLLLMSVFFIGLGTFNAISTWIENIVRPKGLSITQAGMIGGALVLSGIVGAIIIPSISDRIRKRRPLMVISFACSILGLVGLVFSSIYWVLIASACIFGFFILGVGPIGFQYAAEITSPVPETASNGMLMLSGQISGILFIYGLDLLKNKATGSMTLPLSIIICLQVLAVAICATLKESNMMIQVIETDDKKQSNITM